MTIRRGLIGLVIAVTVAIGSGTEAANTDLTVDFDMKFAFAGLKTWRWHPDGSGDVKLAVEPRRTIRRRCTRRWIRSSCRRSSAS
jgi:hypothetical protein